MTLTPGIYPGFPEADYHADCAADGPSLSNSIAKILLTETPAHAYAAHPRLNPFWKPEEFDSTKQQKLDFGNAVHSMLLEANYARVQPIVADDYRKPDTRKQADSIRLDGRIPLLEKHYLRANEMVDAARKQLEASEIGSIIKRGGDGEVTIVWSEGDTRCRSRLDWLSENRTLIVDLKSDTGSANPIPFLRRVLNESMDVQAATYVRGVQVVTGVQPKFIFAVCEANPPYALTLIGLDPGWMAIGERKRAESVRIWADCIARDEWSAYSPRVYWLQCPEYAETAWMNREVRDESGE